MSAEKLHAISSALDAWEAARLCLWHRINERLAARGTSARLRENGRELPTPPGGVTLAGALSALRVAARGLALHLDVPDSFPWLVLGKCALTLTATSIEYELQRLFTGQAADHVEGQGRPAPRPQFDADFCEREIVAPTMKHAEDLRAELRAEQAIAAAIVELKTPLVEMLQALDRLGRANAREICDEIKANVGRNVNPVSAKRPLRDLVKRGLIESGKGRNAEYFLTPVGKAVLQSLPQ